MRIFRNGAGEDVTSSVISYVATHDNIHTADLYLIGEDGDPLAVWLTNWESPLLWSFWGTFQPAVIKRGQVESKIGLEVATLDVEWSPPLSAFGSSLATANPFQKAQSGFYDNMTFRLWRCLMPTPGDADTLGACELFGGRIANSKTERGKITFTVNSFLDVVNQQVPPNVIELNNTAANYAGATPVLSDSETQVPQFTVVAPSSQSSIIGHSNSPSSGKVYGLNKFQNGYLVFNEGSSLAGYWSPISSNGRQTISGTGYNRFIVLAPFPWPPAPGDTFFASTRPPINQADAEAGFPYFGFPYVPQPEGAA